MFGGHSRGARWENQARRRVAGWIVTASGSDTGTGPGAKMLTPDAPGSTMLLLPATAGWRQHERAQHHRDRRRPQTRRGHRLRRQRPASSPGPRHPGGAVHPRLEGHPMAGGDHPPRLRARHRPRQRSPGRQHHDPGRGGLHQDPAPVPRRVGGPDPGLHGLHARQPDPQPAQRRAARQGHRRDAHPGGGRPRGPRLRPPLETGGPLLHRLPRQPA